MHLAIAMDSAGPRSARLAEAAEALRRTIAWCDDRGRKELNLELLSLYMLSSVTMDAPGALEPLVDLLVRYSDEVLRDARRKGRVAAQEMPRVRVVSTAGPERMPLNAAAAAGAVERATRDYRGLPVNIFFAYSLGEDVARAGCRLHRRVERGEIVPSELDAAAVDSFLAGVDFSHRRALEAIARARGRTAVRKSECVEEWLFRSGFF